MCVLYFIFGFVFVLLLCKLFTLIIKILFSFFFLKVVSISVLGTNFLLFTRFSQSFFSVSDQLIGYIVFISMYFTWVRGNPGETHFAACVTDAFLFLLCSLNELCAFFCLNLMLLFTILFIDYLRNL